jgi:hypothetical protein
VAWGDNIGGQGDVPVLPAGLTYVEVAAGGWHTVARRSDGSVVAWGDNIGGQCDVPVLPAGLSYVEVTAGSGHTVARRSDGSVVAWGRNYEGQCNVPALPAGLSYVDVEAGAYNTVARYGGVVLPAVADVTPTNAAQPSPIVVSGTLLDSVTAASVGGQVAGILSQSPTSLELQPLPGDPGFADLALDGPWGTHTFPQAAELFPSLLATSTGVGGTATVELENGAAGLFVLAFGAGALGTPLALGPDIYFGLLIDPGLPLIVMTAGVTPVAGAVVLQYPIPNDSTLSGAILNWQAWCTHGFLPPFVSSSFTNLASMAIQ